MARRTLVTLSVFIQLVAAAAACAADGAKAEGTLTINGRTAKLNYAYARLDTDLLDSSSVLVVLTLSEKPLVPSAVADDFGLMELDHKVNALVFKINDQKRVVSAEVHGESIERMDGSFAATGMQIFEPRVFSRTHIAGRMYMKKADEFLGTTFQYSATFDVPVEPKHVAPRPLQPGEVEAQNATDKGSASSR